MTYTIVVMCGLLNWFGLLVFLNLLYSVGYFFILVVATYKEPLAGWLPRESPSGLMKLLTEAMRGRLSTLRCDDSICAELMPADFAASFILAVATHTASVRYNY